MLTKNAKVVAMDLFQYMHINYKGELPVKTRSGQTRYIASTNFYDVDTFPSKNYSGNNLLLIYTAETTNLSYQNFIGLGSGNATPTENDTDLNTQITSGLTLLASTFENTIDSNGNPVTKLNLTINNTSSASLTIREIAWFVRLSTYSAQGGGNDGSTNYLFMLDRTVLTSPLTLAAGDSGTLEYSLTANWFTS